MADLDLSVKLQLRLRDDISAAADMVNTIEVMRKQLEDVHEGVQERRDQGGAAEAGRARWTRSCSTSKRSCSSRRR